MFESSGLLNRYLNRFINILIIIVLLLSYLSVSTVRAEDDAGWALSFDGVNDYVALGPTGDILGVNWKTTKSISVWIKPTGNSKHCLEGAVYDVAVCDAIIVDHPHFFGIARGIINGQDNIWVWNFDGLTTKIGIPYEVDQWVNIALVHSNGLLKLYRNGNLINSIPSGPTNLGSETGSTQLQLGAFLKVGLTSGAFEGIIDEVRIYSIELTEEMISENLRTHLVGNETGLEAYYQMSNGSGFTLTDDSVHSWDGVLKDGLPYIASNGSFPMWVDSAAFDYPVADDQSITMDEDTENFPITLTGSSPNSSSLDYFLSNPPLKGTLAGTPPSLTYTPYKNYYGSDQFSFYINDGTYDSSEGIVYITINPINDTPSAEPQSLETEEDITLPITLTGNDVDTGDILTFEIVTDPEHG